MSKKFTIFGNPVKHSLSPKMHTYAIEGLNLDATYTKTLLEDGKKLKELFLKNFDGASVTIPHKEIAFELCDEVDDLAKSIKAVNTLIKKDNKMVGYNTDATGFYRSIKEFEGIKSALILGAGGSAKAISTILKTNQISCSILNRSSERLKHFKNLGFETFTWDDLFKKNFDLIINTTSAGLNDSSLPCPKDIMYDIFSNAKYAIDIIYNINTPFLQLAKKFNLKNKDGSDMLLYQGIEAFNLFYDNRFSYDIIEKFMKKAF